MKLPPKWLTWLTWLALIALVALPVMSGLPLPRHSSFLPIKANQKDIVLGLHEYVAGYGRYPVPNQDPLPDSITVNASGALMQALLGHHTQLNPRGVVFLEPPLHRQKHCGLAGNAQNPSYVDPWGRPFYIVLDNDGDGSVINPDAENAHLDIRSIAQPKLNETVAVFSAGKDGSPQTMDDIVSWDAHFRGDVSDLDITPLSLGILRVSVITMLIVVVIAGFWWIVAAWLALDSWLGEHLSQIRRG